MGIQYVNHTKMSYGILLKSCLSLHFQIDCLLFLHRLTLLLMILTAKLQTILCTSYYSKCFMCIYSFNNQIIPTVSYYYYAYFTVEKIKAPIRHLI